MRTTRHLLRFFIKKKLTLLYLLLLTTSTDLLTEYESLPRCRPAPDASLYLHLQHEGRLEHQTQHGTVFSSSQAKTFDSDLTFKSKRREKETWGDIKNPTGVSGTLQIPHPECPGAPE